MQPVIVFAHGAGAGSRHSWMQGWAARLAHLGVVHGFDYAYMAQDRKRPDPPKVLLATHLEAVRAAEAKAPGAPLVLAGKSMGGRIGCHLAVECANQARVRALVCFGYPLRSAASGASRADVLRALQTPVLFVQGTRDPLCPLDELRTLLPSLQTHARLHVVEGADHSLMVAKKTLAAAGQSQADVDDEIERQVASFLLEHGAGGSTTA